MKTSKRFLSIVLMLAMLVSMFTVMAFAGAEEEPQEITITFMVEGEGGKIELRTRKDVLARCIEKTWSTPIGPKDFEGYKVVAVADKGYTGELYYGSEKVPGTEISIGTLTKDVSFKAVFTKGQAEEPKPEPKPDPEPVESEKVYKLAVTINTNGVKNADVKFDSDSILGYSDKTFEIAEASYKKGVTFNASADGAYEVTWKLNGEQSKGDSLKLTGLKEDAVNTLDVTFTEKQAPKPPVEENKYKLTIIADPSKGGAVYYGDKECTSLEGLEKGDERVLTAKAAEGYEFEKWVVTDATISDTVKESTTVTMGEKDATIKAVFREKDTTARKLYVDVTDWSHGDIEYRFKNGWEDFVKTDSPFTLKKGESIRFDLDAESGYVAKWSIDKDAKSYKTDFTVSYDDLSKNGSTLYVVFAKKGSSSVDNSHTLTIDITGAKHGTVKRGTTKVTDGDTFSLDKNETRTFKATPDKGYVAVWTFQGETYVGKEYTVKMGSKNATLYIEFMDEDDYRLTKLPFRDVSEKDWFYDDVVFVYRNGYMEGVSSTKFAPNQNTTRAQIVTILWRLTGEPRATKSNKFNDVSSTAYYDKAVSWAVEAGVVNGFDAKTFKPNDNVTREQLAAILYRYAEYMNLSTRGASNLTKYDDYYKIGTWARDAMAWANYHGLINGVSYTRIDPKGSATRAQVAAILHRFAVEFGNY